MALQIRLRDYQTVDLATIRDLGEKTLSAVASRIRQMTVGSLKPETLFRAVADQCERALTKAKTAQQLVRDKAGVPSVIFGESEGNDG